MFFNVTRRFSSLLFLSFSLVSIAVSQQAVKSDTLQLNTRQQLLRYVYQELIEINTTDSVGDTTKAAEAMAVRFRAAGFPEADVRVLVHPGNNRKGNLVARFRMGSGNSDETFRRTARICRARRVSRFRTSELYHGNFDSG
jgi:hypothetical protein